MGYYILNKESDWQTWKVVNNKDIKKLTKLNNKGFKVIATSPTKEKAYQMVLGIKAEMLVEVLANKLDSTAKQRLKIEIARLASDLYNNIITNE